MLRDLVLVADNWGIDFLPHQKVWHFDYIKMGFLSGNPFDAKDQTLKTQEGKQTLDTLS